MSLLDDILQWLTNRSEVRAVLLTGSRAGNKGTDELSDYDLAIFGNGFTFLDSDEWLQEISPSMVCIHDHFFFSGHVIPTRLVIFDSLIKVDFSFHPLEILTSMTKEKVLPDAYNIGYRVLLDKDHLAMQLPAPGYQGFIVQRPSENEYQQTMREFWFEVYHVAKYLKRGDLWTATSRQWAAQQFLLQMMIWEQAKHEDWNFSPMGEGRGIQNWLSKDRLHELEQCFRAFNIKDSYRALENTIQLYRKLAHKVATALYYMYDERLDETISSFTVKMRNAE